MCCKDSKENPHSHTKHAKSVFVEAKKGLILSDRRKKNDEMCRDDEIYLYLCKQIATSLSISCLYVKAISFNRRNRGRL